MNIFKRARTVYILHRYAIPHDVWLDVVENMALLKNMSAVEKAHLREVCTLFLHEKNLVGAQNLRLSPAMRVSIAVQACLPILRFGMACLSGWTDVVVYPGAFRVSRDSMDEAGVVHRREQVLSGESWSRGPLVLSWADLERDRLDIHSGQNVAIHEIAHKLDALNGSVNGFPPLHPEMSIPHWTEAMSNAYQNLTRDLELGHRPVINPYAATSPAEFFAVISEYFFCAPEILHSHFAEVYRQLQLYYRQDPLLRRHAELS